MDRLSDLREGRDRLLPPNAVAQLMGVDTHTVLRWTREGKLPGLRLPSGRYRYSENFVNDLVSNLTVDKSHESR